MDSVNITHVSPYPDYSIISIISISSIVINSSSSIMIDSSSSSNITTNTMGSSSRGSSSSESYSPSTYDNVTDSAAEYYPLLKQPWHVAVIYTVVYLLVFILGVLGNLLVILVIYWNVNMRTVTNYFIVNLAVADALVCLFCLPVTLLTNLLSGWVFGAVLCKLVPFLQGLAVNASVNTLAAIALDRYVAICQTLKIRFTRRSTRAAIFLIWLSAACVMVPWLVYYQQIDISTQIQTIYLCIQLWPTPEMERFYFLCAIFLTCYTVPLLFTSVCYTLIACRIWNSSRSRCMIAFCLSPGLLSARVKVVKMLVAVMIVFAVSWLPLYAVNVRIYFGPEIDVTGSEFDLLSRIVVPVVQWLGLANSCINPVIYCAFSVRFRNGFRKVFSSRKSNVSLTRSGFGKACKRKSVTEGDLHSMPQFS